MLLSESGFMAKTKELDELQEELQKVWREKALSISQADGDAWHDNFGFEQAVREERRIISEMRKLKGIIKNATVIPDSDYSNEESVHLNATVTISVDYGDGDIENMTGKMVDLKTKNDGEITLNSPIGQAIMGKRVGDNTKCTLPNGVIAKITIVDISFSK